MTKGQQFGHSLAEAAAKHPRRAKAVGWTIIGILVLLPIAIIWHDLSEGKFLKIIIPTAVAVVYLWRHSRQAKRASRAKS